MLYRYPIILKLLLVTGIGILWQPILAQHPDSVKAPFYEKHFSVLTGVGLNKNYFIDVGVAKVSTATFGHHPWEGMIYFSNEIHFNNNFLYGAKLGAWSSMGMGLGINMVYYTDFEQGSLVTRPEVGGGIGGIKIHYGYNFKLTNLAFEKVHRHVFGLSVFINTLIKNSEE